MPGVTLNLNPETEQVLLTQAQEHRVPLDTYLEDLLRKQASVESSAAASGEPVEIPLLHLGVIGPLCRRDVYDDIDDGH